MKTLTNRLWLLNVLFLTWLMPMLVGCRARCPHAGYVLVNFDPRFETAEVLTGTTLENSDYATRAWPLLQNGLRYWDQMGVKFRTLDMLQPDEWDEATYNPSWVNVLYIPGFDRDHSIAAKSFGTDTHIEFYAANAFNNYGSPDNWSLLSVIIAHEIGHSMGLDHVQDKGNVMYPYSGPLPGLGPQDRQEFVDRLPD